LCREHLRFGSNFEDAADVVNGKALHTARKAIPK
jgi:hypothetical protein